MNTPLNTENIAVIDTETNYRDRVMSIGIVVANAENYTPINARYFIVTPEYKVGGMYSNALERSIDRAHAILSREETISRTFKMLQYYGVEKIFAYNGKFDHAHLPELADYKWHDIMKIASYRQTNPFIPACVECCKSGRIRSGYGVEAIYRMCVGDRFYRESHDALSDAFDELEIMRALNHPLSVYEDAWFNA